MRVQCFQFLHNYKSLAKFLPVNMVLILKADLIGIITIANWFNVDSIPIYFVTNATLCLT